MRRKLLRRNLVRRAARRHRARDRVSTASAGVPAAASPLGTKKAATGATVTIGLVSDGKSDAIDNTPEIKAAQAAVKYANAYLGGLAGHKIALNVCETHQTPSGATDCGTNMVQANVPVVLTPVSGQSGSIYTAYQGVGYPVRPSTARSTRACCPVRTPSS